MASRAARATDFLRLKLKLGGRDGLDVERVRAVRATTEVPLQVDVTSTGRWTRRSTRCRSSRSWVSSTASNRCRREIRMQPA